jgi:hypothetical protein
VADFEAGADLSLVVDFDAGAFLSLSLDFAAGLDVPWPVVEDLALSLLALLPAFGAFWCLSSLLSALDLDPSIFVAAPVVSDLPFSSAPLFSAPRLMP